jgi:glycosyltransferase involved in cell wall biosynthesis
VKILNVFNHYLERGGEAHAVEAISESLSRIVGLENCYFYSATWRGRDRPATWKQAIWTLRNPASLKKIREHQRQLKPGLWLLHNVLPVGSAAIYLEAKRQDVPIIQYVHNFRPFSVSGYLWVDSRVAIGGLSGNYWEEIRYGAWQNSRVKTAWLAFILSLSRALGWWESVKAWIAVSDFMREKFISAGIPAESVFTLRNFRTPRPEINDSSETSHYLFLGRLIEAKGILVLLKAWEILEQRIGANAPRLIIGGDGPLRAHVLARAERMASVQFPGELRDDTKHRALESARAVIVPSVWWEPLPTVVYEAYDYCRPVLAASSGGLSEIVLNRRTGLLHEAGNAEELADHVMQLEKDAEACRAMGREGRLWLEENADETRWQEEFIRIAAYAMSRSGRQGVAACRVA